MKLSEAIRKGKNKRWDCVHIRRNPSSPNEWFAMLVGKKQMQFMLVDEDDLPISSEDLNVFSELSKQLNVREFTVFL